MGVKRAHERTVLALGAQRRVQWPQRRLGRGGGDDVSELSGQVRADLHEALLADRLLSPLRLAGGGDDVDDVDVRDVVELAGPGLSHGDHCEGHVVGLRSDGGAGDEQGRVQGGVGKLGHAAAHGGDVLDRVGAGEVIGDDRREPVPVGTSQRRGRLADGSVSRVWGSLTSMRGGRIRGVGLPQRVADRPLQRLTGAGLLRGVPRPVRCERGEVLGMGHEEVAQGLRGTQDREQAAPVLLTRPCGGVAHDAAQKCCWRRRPPGLDTAHRCPVARFGRGRGLSEPDEAEQSHVGIGGERQSVNELLTLRPQPYLSRSAVRPPGAVR